MHLFLSGSIQVGKSTIIRNYLSKSGLSADGFMTYWEYDGNGGRCLYLAPYCVDIRFVAEKCLIKRIAECRFSPLEEPKRGLSPSEEPKRRFSPSEEPKRRPSPSEETKRVFDTYGAEILAASGKRDVVVMDELGFLESDAIEFRQAVMRHISGHIPVLGVIKPVSNEFLDEVRSSPRVEVCEVTVENRIEVSERLASRRTSKCVALS